MSQYKRAIAYPYSIPYFQQDLLSAALLHVRKSYRGVDRTIQEHS